MLSTKRLMQIPKAKRRMPLADGFDRKARFQWRNRRFRPSHEDDPTDATLYFDHGLAKSVLKDFEGAIADYEKALQLKPDFQRARENLTKRGCFSRLNKTSQRSTHERLNLAQQSSSLLWPSPLRF